MLSAYIITNAATGKSKGFGFVEFLEQKSAKEVIDIQYHIVKGVKVSCSLYLKRGKKYYQEFKDLEERIDRNRHHRGGHNNNRRMNQLKEVKSCVDMKDNYIADQYNFGNGQMLQNDQAGSNQDTNSRYNHRGSFLQTRTQPNRSVYHNNSQRGSIFYNNTVGGQIKAYTSSASSHYPNSGPMTHSSPSNNNRLFAPNMEGGGGAAANFNFQQQGSPSTGYYLRRVPHQQGGQNQNQLIPPHIMASAKRNSLQNENLVAIMNARNATKDASGGTFRNRRSLIPTTADIPIQPQYNYEGMVNNPNNPKRRNNYLQAPGGGSPPQSTHNNNSNNRPSPGGSQQQTMPTISITQCEDADFSHLPNNVVNSPRSNGSENQIKNMSPDLSSGFDRKQSVFRDFHPPNMAGPGYRQGMPHIGINVEHMNNNPKNYGYPGNKQLNTPSTAARTFGGFLNFPMGHPSSGGQPQPLDRDNRDPTVSKELFGAQNASQAQDHAYIQHQLSGGSHSSDNNQSLGEQPPEGFFLQMPGLLNQPGPKKRERNSLAVGTISGQKKAELGKRISLAPPPGLELRAPEEEERPVKDERKLTVDDVQSEKGSEDGDEPPEVELESGKGGGKGKEDKNNLSDEGELLKECFKL